MMCVCAKFHESVFMGLKLLVGHTYTDTERKFYLYVINILTTDSFNVRMN